MYIHVHNDRDEVQLPLVVDSCTYENRSHLWMPAHISCSGACIYMYMYMYLLDITKQQCCIEWFVSGLYNYVHSSNKLVVVNYIDIQQISCSAQTGAAFALAGLMLSFWALQLLYTCKLHVGVHVYTLYIITLKCV